MRVLILYASVGHDRGQNALTPPGPLLRCPSRGAILPLMIFRLSF
jgi:hypothetical protein